MSIAGVGSDKNGDPRPYGLGIMSFFTLMTIAGGVLLGVGTTNQSSFAAFNPTTDFKIEGSPSDPFTCSILNHTHTTAKRSYGRSWIRYKVCMDIYKYIFVDTTTNITYSSGVDEWRRSDYGECKTTDTQAEGPMYDSTDPMYDSTDPMYDSIDSTRGVTCWTSTKSPLPANAFTFYDCGNPACVKIFDPQWDLDDALAGAAVLILIGSILLGVGCPMCGVLVFCTIRCHKKIQGAKGSYVTETA